MRRFLLIVAFCLAPALQAAPDEGMWPISDIHKLPLKDRGLLIDPTAIYNPNGVSLIDAIVMVGGCTGSFVSPEGLILTNHHCAFGAVAAASTAEKDYVKRGFLAATRNEEIPARGLTVRLIESYRDVSAEVLSAVSGEMDYSERARALERKIKEMVQAAEQAQPGRRAEIAEMFIGKTYVLFLYTHLKDVRLVYVPPRSIGEFGGEEDNWVWPRHTGDFSFLRAYVAPDGSPAEYSPDNVPYHPKAVLRVAPEGVNEDDFVFLLGYPGRTYRHQTAAYLAFEQEVRMPYVADLYEWQIKTMEEQGRADRSVALKHASRIKSLANTMKNYRGKLKGLQRLALVEQKRAQEQALQAFIAADPGRRQKYGTLLAEIAQVYDDMRATAERDLLLQHLGSVTLFRFGFSVYEASRELQKPDLERLPAYMERNFNTTKQSLQQAVADFHEPTDRIFLKELLLRAARLPAKQRLAALADIVAGDDPQKTIDKFIRQAYARSKLKDGRFLMACLEKPPRELQKLKDPFLTLAQSLYPAYEEMRRQTQRRNGALEKLYGQLIEVKKEFRQADFIPDANRTLRFTYGRVRGYSPADAVYYRPITTLSGVIAKTTGREPFDTPEKLIQLHRAKDYGRFAHPQLHDVPVAVLYNLDTTGGNSGSPLLNARGELVGVNFDRAFEATINDYAWSEDYSRSIAVDIRYVLWVTQKFAGADYLLQEMGITPSAGNE
ncbi:MAG: S46 family peptidase [candidate division KSB1 bacterium]|nr:S46 family peptidase [candidate division KSB1 bacterium]MDZ7273586.1 S46 family peptidase [candidate division KSB1 bacterium]MDZ7286823.1 S46 family peptidase [candidate division KSB1 bacterium]MDZ7299820.1 S46 family peptidase [candidate division KSB1 bacterium]MDZ7308455.1 S46 family peptidase [candidate division KSB1 bacterium]